MKKMKIKKIERLIELILLIVLMFMLGLVLSLIISTTKAEAMTNLDTSNLELREMFTHETGNSQKMVYMDYRAITNTASDQYRLQQHPQCTINEQGFLTYQDTYYAVAMGSYWGEIGDKFIVRLENGNVINCIIGDRKADIDTDKLNYAHNDDGHILEFLIDSDSPYMIQAGIRELGLVNLAFSEFDSKIVSICKVCGVKPRIKNENQYSKSKLKINNKNLKPKSKMKSKTKIDIHKLITKFHSDVGFTTGEMFHEVIGGELR